MVKTSNLPATEGWNSFKALFPENQYLTSLVVKRLTKHSISIKIILYSSKKEE
jgi:hypothetical protein